MMMMMIIIIIIIIIVTKIIIILNFTQNNLERYLAVILPFKQLWNVVLPEKIK